MTMMQAIEIQKMTAEKFKPFGDIIDFDRPPSFAINNGMCDRYHALAQTEVTGTNAQIIISLGRAKSYSLPLKLEMMERHPYGSQAFIPLQQAPFLVIVAADDGGQPATPNAFMTQAGQGINYHRNVWHAVLTPIDHSGDFLIVDRIGEENNLEEFFFNQPYLVQQQY